MQPKVQITTRGIQALRTGALEVLLQYIWRFGSGHTLTLTYFNLTLTRFRIAVQIECVLYAKMFISDNTFLIIICCRSYSY